MAQGLWTEDVVSGRVRRPLLMSEKKGGKKMRQDKYNDDNLLRYLENNRFLRPDDEPLLDETVVDEAVEEMCRKRSERVVYRF